jgi:hypothetical protein
MAQPEVVHFLSSVEPSEAQIQGHPKLLVLFGGQVASAAERGAGIPPKTQRDAFVGWLEKNHPDVIRRTILPENFPDWSDFDVYSDLLQFEEDLSHLTAAVLIFLEAPGAIAELGAFSQMSALRDRLAVVVEERYHPVSSFISLGPLKFLEDIDEESVCVIADHPLSSFGDAAPVVMDALTHASSKLKVRHRFDPKDKGHQLLLALDVITLSEVATFPSIEAAFAHFEIHLKEQRLRQLLFTLEKAGLIRKKKHGGKYWFIPVRRKTTWIDYTGPLGAPFHRSRVLAKMVEIRTSADETSRRAHDWFVRKAEAK